MRLPESLFINPTKQNFKILGQTKQTKHVKTCGANYLLGKMTQQRKYSQILLTAKQVYSVMKYLNFPSLRPGEYITLCTQTHTRLGVNESQLL